MYSHVLILNMYIRLIYRFDIFVAYCSRGQLNEQKSKNDDTDFANNEYDETISTKLWSSLSQLSSYINTWTHSYNTICE